MSGPDWGKLVAQGRAKAHGVPWEEAELHAIYKLKIPVEFVRRGCLTQKDYENTQEEDGTVEEETGEKPLESMNRFELIKLAKTKYSIGGFDSRKITKEIVIKLIEEKKKKKKIFVKPIEIEEKKEPETPITDMIEEKK